MRLTVRPAPEMSHEVLEVGEITFSNWFCSPLWPRGRVPKPLEPHGDVPRLNGIQQIAKQRDKEKNGRNGNKRTKGNKGKKDESSSSDAEEDIPVVYYQCPPTPAQIVEDCKWAKSQLTNIDDCWQHGFDK